MRNERRHWDRLTTPNGPDDSIFHAYDVRGRYPDEVDAVGGQRLGEAIGRSVQGPYFLARDTRRESARFQAHVAAGLRRAGQRVRSVGVLPTPTVAYAAREFGVCGLSASPSHNPLGYVGLKGFRPDGRIFADEWSTIRSAFLGESRAKGERRLGSPRLPDLLTVRRRYLEWVTDGPSALVSVAVDGRGGASGPLARSALRRLGATVAAVDATYSPTFFGRSPEPTPSESSRLSAAVRKSGSVFGATFDGDGDRVLFLDQYGKWVLPEVVALCLARRSSGRYAPLVATVDASKRLEELTRVTRTRVGSRFVVEAMRSLGVSVGVEASSHLFLEGAAESSDGVQVTVELARRLAAEPGLLAEVARELGPIHRASESWTYATFSVRDGSFDALRSALAGERTDEIDGFSVLSSDGSTLVRCSNTQPSVRFALESRDASGLSRLKRRVARWRSVHGRNARAG